MVEICVGDHAVVSEVGSTPDGLVGVDLLSSERGELFDRVVAVVLTPENSGEPVVAQLIFLDRVQATIVFA